MTAAPDQSGDTSTPDSPADTRVRTVLLAVLAVAVLVIVGGAGWLIRGDGGSDASASPSAVDVGFSRDMAVHHTQAVTMAGIERDGTTDSALRIYAFDIETGQQFQVGQMQGWLDGWGLTRTSDDPMAWMGHDHMAMGASGLMPGMATEAQLDQLVRLRGKALDIRFLQLMIHHHQGGVPMARYAAEHATEPYVQNLAAKMVAAQSNEILQMEQMLRRLGGKPLAPPT